MWDDEVLSDHLEAGLYEHLFFDQCCTREHPCVQKTTQLSATRRLAAALRKRFMHLRCRLPNSQHVHVPGGPRADGTFASEALSRYSSHMNRLIVESVVETVRLGEFELGGGRFPCERRLVVLRRSIWPSLLCPPRSRRARR